RARNARRDGPDRSHHAQPPAFAPPSGRQLRDGTSEGVLDFWKKLSRILYVVGPGLVGVALVVGGIVITNIMLMAVAERTRECGIRKSLGARRRDILRQFLAEATALATVGASLGIV